jgi:GPH family glycoside/pentoside/hexuronide:cation symporter
MTPTIYDSSLGWTGVAFLWSGVAVLFYFLSLIGIRENPAYAEQHESTPIFSQFRLALQNRIFVLIICLNFVLRFVVGVLLLSLPFYTKYVLEVGGSGQSIITGALLLSLALSLIGWQHLYKRWGTRRALIVSFSVSAFCVVPLLFTGGVIDTASVMVVLGICVGGIALAPDMLFAELIDEDYVRSGIRREGLYRGILGFMFRFPPAFAGLMLSELLNRTGFDPDLSVDAQPQTFVTMLRIFTASAPTITVILGIVLMQLYPLHGKRLQAIQAKAQELRLAMKASSG